MLKITVDVDGMQCGMCENHVNEAVRGGVFCPDQKFVKDRIGFINPSVMVAVISSKVCKPISVGSAEKLTAIIYSSIAFCCWQ